MARNPKTVDVGRVTRFEVKNYKSIKSAALDIPRSMVLVGPNGAGKTNFVRALELFGDVLSRRTTEPIRDQGWAEIIHREKRPARGGLSFHVALELPAVLAQRTSPRGRDGASESGAPITCSFGLKVNASSEDDEIPIVEESIAIGVGDERIWARLSADGNVAGGGNAGPRLAALLHLDGPHPSDTTPTALYLRILKDDIRHHGRFPNDATRSTLRLLSGQVFWWPFYRFASELCQVARLRLDAAVLHGDVVPLDAPLRGQIGLHGEGLARAIDRLRSRGTGPDSEFEQVRSALRSVYSRIEDIDVDRAQPGRPRLLFKERGIAEKIGQHSMSDGVLHALALLVVLRDPSASGIVAIEEPENALHPWALQQIVAAAQDSPRQVILTTHSTEAVNAVRDVDSLFIVENHDRNGTVITRARDHEAAIDSILRDSGQKLGDLWMGGSLGGVPGSEP